MQALLLALHQNTDAPAVPNGAKTDVEGLLNFEALVAPLGSELISSLPSTTPKEQSTSPETSTVYSALSRKAPIASAIPNVQLNGEAGATVAARLSNQASSTTKVPAQSLNNTPTEINALGPSLPTAKAQRHNAIPQPPAGLSAPGPNGALPIADVRTQALAESRSDQNPNTGNKTLAFPVDVESVEAKPDTIMRRTPLIAVDKMGADTTGYARFDSKSQGGTAPLASPDIIASPASTTTPSTEVRGTHLQHTPSMSNAGAPQPISEQIRTAIIAKPSSGTIEVQLDPPELGRVQLEIETSRAGQLRIVVAAAEADTFDLLRRHQAQLMSELSDQGFEDIDLDWQREGDAASDGSSLLRGTPTANQPEADDTARATSINSAPSHEGLIDLTL